MANIKKNGISKYYFNILEKNLNQPSQLVLKYELWKKKIIIEKKTIKMNSIL